MYRFALLPLLAALPAAAPAATLGVFTHDYGQSLVGGIGLGLTDGLGLESKHDPEGTDLLLADSVLVDDSPTGDAPGAFRDSFDISSLARHVIESITLTIRYSDSQDTTSGERWAVHFPGSTANSRRDDIHATLTDEAAVTTLDLVMSQATDFLGVDAFARAMQEMEVGFHFTDYGTNTNTFELYDAVLTVNGTAVVPIPAPGVLLLGTLVGGAAWRRRKQQRQLSAPAAA